MSQKTHIEQLAAFVLRASLDEISRQALDRWKLLVRSKEQADHSLPYLTAVALQDGEVTPHQFTSDRIQAADVQALLKKVRTLRDDQFTVRYPNETPSRVVVEFRDGRSVAAETNDWLGFFARPMPPSGCATRTGRSPPTTSTRDSSARFAT
jgi:2-methylcitrate dehydratase PrpD